MSTMTTSRPRARPASTASKATAAGSAPREPPTKSAPARSAQISSCSSAAARNVSAAPTRTVRPCSRELLRELPDRRRLPGAVDADDEDDGRAVGGRRERRAARRRASPPRRRARRRGRRPRRGPRGAGRARRSQVTPTSARMSATSSRSQASSSAGSKDAPSSRGQRAPALAERVAQPREEAGPLLARRSAPSRRRRAARPTSATWRRTLGRAGSARVSCDALVARQAARDDLGDAVAAHRHAVEDVRRLHRALLVRDHDELRAVGVATKELDEPRDVRVVERRLDLVEEVERARPREEEREEERDRAERLLAAREQRQPRDLLPGRSKLDLDPCLDVAVLVGLDEPQPALAAREERRGDLLEVRGDGRERLVEAAVDRLGQLVAERGELGERLPRDRRAGPSARRGAPSPPRTPRARAG